MPPIIWPGPGTDGPLHGHEACLLHRAVLQKPEGNIESGLSFNLSDLRVTRGSGGPSQLVQVTATTMP